MNTLQKTETRLNSFDVNRSIIEQFINAQDIRPKSKETYKKGVSYFVDYLKENSITQPTRETILDYKNHLKENYTNSTASTYLTACRVFFVWLNSVTGYPIITAGIKNPKNSSNRHLKDALTVEQARDVLKTQKRDTITDKRNFAIIELMTLTGLRTIEVTRANVEDVRSLDGVTVLYIQGKGRDAKDEFIKLPSTVLTAINDYLETRSTLAPVKDNQPLFTSTSNHNNNERLTTRSISRIAKTALRNTGLNSSRLTAHSLRHTAVTLALKGGANIRDVQQMARHSSVQTTERYAHDLRRLANSAEDTAEAYLLAV